MSVQLIYVKLHINQLMFSHPVAESLPEMQRFYL